MGGSRWQTLFGRIEGKAVKHREQYSLIPSPREPNFSQAREPHDAVVLGKNLPARVKREQVLEAVSGGSQKTGPVAVSIPVLIIK